MFQRSYLDTIKIIKKKESKDAKLPIMIDAAIGESHTDDLLTDEYWYQKDTTEFTKSIFDVQKTNNSSNNINSEKYEPLLSSDGYLSTIFHINNPTVDFLTGTYIGQLARQTLQYDEVFQSYILGANQPSLINGMHCVFHRPLKWSWFGSDKYHAPPIPPNYLNGAFGSQTGIRDVNVIHNISIQLAEKTNNLMLVVCDIKPVSSVDLYISLAMILNASDRGQGFMRMPTIISDKFTYEQLAAFYLLVSYLYNTVKIHKTTWTKECKFYLQLSGVKIRRKDRYRLKVIKFIEKLLQTPQLYILHADLIKEKYNLTIEGKSDHKMDDTDEQDLNVRDTDEQDLNEQDLNEQDTNDTDDRDANNTDEEKTNKPANETPSKVIPFDKNFLSYMTNVEPEMDGDIIIAQWLEFMKAYLK